MTFTELRDIVAVAQELHFGHAAERVCVSQPDLSLAIKKLEDELGTDDFRTTPEPNRLTPLGEQIVHQAQRVLEEAEHITLIAAQGKDHAMLP
jgi:LysR family hydrogen peroxide-inducible transcriptional activator